MKKVCLVIFNQVLNSARIMKESQSLAEAGHDVTAIGLQEEAEMPLFQQLPSGVLVRRAKVDGALFKPDLRHCLFSVVALVLIALALSLGLSMLSSHYFQLRQPYLGLTIFLIAIIAAATYATAYRWIRVYRDLRKIYRRACRAAESLGENKKSDKCWPRWKRRFNFEPGVFELLCQEKPDIVHAHDVGTLPLCACYKKISGAKLIFDAHEMYDQMEASTKERRRNRQTILKYAHLVDVFITINESIAEYYAKNFPQLPPAFIIKNAARLSPPIEYDGRLHKAAGLPPEQLIALFQGHYLRERGLPTLVAAAEFLKPGRSIVFMGDGLLEESLRATAGLMVTRKPVIEDRIRFVPKVKFTELAEWTAGAAVGLIPYENTCLNHWLCNPNKLWEYPNASVPMLVSPFPELKKFVTEHQIGWLLPEKLSPENLAAAINALEPEELALGRVRAREFIQKDNWAIYEKCLLESYRSITHD